MIVRKSRIRRGNGLLQFANQNVFDTATSLRKHLNCLSELKSTVAQFRLFHGSCKY